MQTKEGWIIELQLIPEAMHALKGTLGHAEYTKYRFIIEAGRQACAVDAEGGGGRAAIDGIDESSGNLIGYTRQHTHTRAAHTHTHFICNVHVYLRGITAFRWFYFIVLRFKP